MPFFPASGCRHPCKSLSRENTVLLTRASEERAPPVLASIRSSHLCLSAVVPAFAEPDIHSLSRAPEGREVVDRGRFRTSPKGVEKWLNRATNSANIG